MLSPPYPPKDSISVHAPDACYELLLIAPTINGDLVQNTRHLLDLYMLQVHSSMKFVSNLTTSACFCFQITGTPQPALRAALLEMSHQHQVDWILQPVAGQKIRLVAFDMDATLIRQETLDELAKKTGVFGQVSAITQAAMNGEIDFQESLASRVALLKGLECSQIERIAQQVDIMEGAHTLLDALKQSGTEIVVISSGFNDFAVHLQKQLPIDAIYTNHFKVRQGKLTGHTQGDIIDADKKAQILQKIMIQDGLQPHQVAAVGDGANDIPMLQQAGIGIAFHAKPLVQQQTHYHIHYNNLDSLLYPLGLCDKIPYVIHKAQ